MTDPATDAAKRAAALFAKRDKLAAKLAVVDSDLKRATQDYSAATRVWGFTPLMMRRECKLKGLAS
tara:strand:+ start:1310 stop:1507 length:198 start_codon:yes stop_codon:yes gene_type:complete